MIQIIFVILIVAVALYFAIAKIFKRVHHKKGTSPCDGCAGCALKQEWGKTHDSCDHRIPLK